MAKLFIQEMPSQDQVKTALSRIHEGVDSWALYANLLFRKVGNDLENHIESLLAPYNLSAGRFTLLYLLKDSPEGLMPSELSQKVGVTQATISGLINGLEKAELVTREIHQKDGRSFVIKLTDKGDQTLKEIFPKWAPTIAAFWNQFDAQEKEVIGKALEKMVQNTGLLRMN
ncbi:MarR family transcriptional regulator [Bdellovibrio sp. 22V]|uniref:MarR family winged helix-turn-helix transcriptional regulator n=1 Tax=Bdellovibrio TaxID=958 RepID=UPI00254340E9|nr:MarR family transcriptional regulator [Bdellovibrio sp. 22V]WII73186.1 MarR family transcriptional regulator [Bdellovibrio sp. 22V]